MTTILLKILLIFCVILVMHCADGRGGGRGGSGSRSVAGSKGSSHGFSTFSSKDSSRKTTGSGLLNFLRGGSSSKSSSTSSGAKIVSPASLSHNGFSVYGSTYASNFHHSRPNQIRPVPHPYQSHFQPQKTGERVLSHKMMLIMDFSINRR